MHTTSDNTSLKKRGLEWEENVSQTLTLPSQLIHRH